MARIEDFFFGIYPGYPAILLFSLFLCVPKVEQQKLGGGLEMRLGYVIIYVKDVIATINFYEKAFELKPRFIHESQAYAEMETGQTALAFVAEEMAQSSLTFRPNRKAETPSGIEICLVTENVQAQFDKAVKAGATPVIKPMEKPWGQIVSYVKDNNGCLVEICNPIS